MADLTDAPISSQPASIPQKRPLPIEDKHAPAVASPLNPSTRIREERTKKPTAKVRKESPEPTATSKKGVKKAAKELDYPRPTRYRLNAPTSIDFEPPPPPLFIPVSTRKGRTFHQATELITNKKGFRYANAIADPQFTAIQYMRLTEPEPYGAHMAYEDASAQVLFDKSNAVSTEKGFRMCRANVGAREGRWYWECRILSGVKPPNEQGTKEEAEGHVRVGWARREATLEGPVGFDAYSYGIRDVGGQKVTRSRPLDFAVSDLCEGDVIGLEITLPSLPFHRKVVEGVYNKAVDSSDDLDPAASIEEPNIVRDRTVFPYRTRRYWENFEYGYTKPLEDYMNPSPLPVNTTSEVDPPSPNNPIPQLRTLPFSSIKVYKNGELMGTPFTDLLAFLPPASKPVPQPTSREGLDDGMLGYYPAISVFRGGAAEANFGPDFAYPPTELLELEDVQMENGESFDPSQRPDKPFSGSRSRLRPMCDRFNEQIAEDIVYDLIDEIDFWALDGSNAEGSMKDLTEAAPITMQPIEMDTGVAVAMDGRKPATFEMMTGQG
ncbi:uncharacterized protein KY384_005554 [Bacidia gigantensis]|uniref:uncharacterized protein n=1 Tax=Bacidia gigantensis TaxID=2732470 RepID=UPI001D03C38F|nr:uncharacterized protein KY384_005554 [Bacidia gigantensis]KAG8530072.1 hypothetical protein KY384_005554 [Bacidia gigantensis]